MSQTVVHDLESVEADDNHSELLARVACQLFSQVHEKLGAVEQIRERVMCRAVAKFIGLPPVLGHVSAVTRRVVEIGAQLAAHPKVLLLDEPSSGISRHDTARLAALLLRVRDELEASLVLTEHDMGLVRELADRLVALDLGEVVTIGNPDDVLVHPRVLESYLGNLDPYAANAAPQ